ncbi:Rab30 [Symbiodinium sp. KB8]|nr:Rab30 [Symbiodinium sp. KB8]
MAAEGVDSTMTIATAGRAAVGKTTLVLALQRGRPAADGTACESTIGVETASVLVKSGGQNHRMSVFDTSGEHRGAVLGAVRAWGGARAVRGASTPERAQLRPTLPACASLRLPRLPSPVAGEERFMSTTQAFLRERDAYLLVYSLADLGSIRDIHEKWVPACVECAPERAVFVVVGNKLDLVPTEPDERPELLTEALATMQERVLELTSSMATAPLFLETSAVRGDRLAELPGEVVRAVLGTRRDLGLPMRTGRVDHPSHVTLESGSGPSAYCCS